MRSVLVLCALAACTPRQGTQLSGELRIASQTIFADEVLWELGLRPDDPPGTPERDPERSRDREHAPSVRRQRPRRSRVQHVDIQD